MLERSRARTFYLLPASTSGNDLKRASLNYFAFAQKVLRAEQQKAKQTLEIFSSLARCLLSNLI